MNFSQATIDAAARFTSAVGVLLDDPTTRANTARALRARGAAVTWGGMDDEELNALARICGHPFAPDLPEWMTVT